MTLMLGVDCTGIDLIPCGPLQASMLLLDVVRPLVDCFSDFATCVYPSSRNKCSKNTTLQATNFNS